MADDWIIDPAFKELEPYLRGEPRQFLVDSNQVFCVRKNADPKGDDCAGCPYVNNGCELAGTKKIQTTSIPHPRRGVGIEEESFLVLLPNPESPLPKALYPYPEFQLGHDEANIHWLIPDWDTTKLKALKDQYRFYGTEAEFAASPYAPHFTIYESYVPKHMVVSIDYSAIEPRISTMVSREPKWLEAFKGIPKPFYREVAFDRPVELPPYVLIHETKHYCHRTGEMSDIFKSDYESQCAVCPIKFRCTTVQDFFKSVPLDWHATNRDALYRSQVSQLKKIEVNFEQKAELVYEVSLPQLTPETVSANADLADQLMLFDGKQYCQHYKLQQCRNCPLSNSCTKLVEYTSNSDGQLFSSEGQPLGFQPVILTLVMEDYGADGKKILKGLRDISKIVALALCYGGTAWTVSANMKSSVEDAEMRISEFFSDLTTLAQYMNHARQAVLINGYVVNLFGRVRDVRKFSHPTEGDFKQKRKDQGYAQRTALNHPIQSTAGEILKFGMDRVTLHLEKNNLDPWAGVNLKPQQIRPGYYQDFIYVLVSSVHDELPYVVREDQLNDQTPFIYKTMQLGDILQGMGIDFTLESDVEHDNTRSWLSTVKLDVAQIYLRHFLLTKEQTGGANAEPNMALLKFEDLTHELLARIKDLTAQELHASAQAQDGLAPDHELCYYLGVEVKGVVYLYDSKVSKHLLSTLGVPYVNATMDGAPINRGSFH